MSLFQFYSYIDGSLYTVSLISATAHFTVHQYKLLTSKRPEEFVYVMWHCNSHSTNDENSCLLGCYATSTIKYLSGNIAELFRRLESCVYNFVADIFVLIPPLMRPQCTSSPVIIKYRHTGMHTCINTYTYTSSIHEKKNCPEHCAVISQFHFKFYFG